MRTPDKIKNFYKNDPRWKKARLICIERYHGRCSWCGKRGTEVHHKIHLTLDNIDNLDISIGQDNLELLCRSCHDSERRKGLDVRSDVTFDSDGNMIYIGTPGDQK